MPARGATAAQRAAGRHAAIVEDVLWLLRSGADRDEIARRTDRHWHAIERQMQRLGRGDIVRASSEATPDARSAAAARCPASVHVPAVAAAYAPTWPPTIPAELVATIDAAYARHLDAHADRIALGAAS